MEGRGVIQTLGDLGEVYHLRLDGRVATVAVPTERAAVFGVFGSLGLGLRPLQTNWSVMLRSIWSGRRRIGETELSALCESPRFAVEQSIYDSRIIEPFARLWAGLGDFGVNLSQFHLRAAEGAMCDVLVVDCERWFFVLAPIDTDSSAPSLRRTA